MLESCPEPLGGILNPTNNKIIKILQEGLELYGYHPQLPYPILENQPDP